MSKYTAKQIAESDDLFAEVARAVKNQHHKKKI